MTDPKIGIAARAIQAAADDHEEFCSASLVQAAARAVLTALTAARATAAPDDNALPMDQLPEGWAFLNVLVFFDGIFQCELRPTQSGADVSGRGPTPRAAMMAAIKAAGPT